ncbi:MAG: hypothetical protein CMN73_06900 [Sphingomonas sp.]|nr:hypothetical protein [Sphingomonas sp.]
MTKAFFGCAVATALAAFAAPSAAFAQDSYNREVVIENAGNSAIYFIYFSHSDDDHWGDDRLGEEEVVEAGATRLFDFNDGSGECVFDVQATFENGETVELYEVNVCGVSTLDANEQRMWIEE